MRGYPKGDITMKLATILFAAGALLGVATLDTKPAQAFGCGCRTACAPVYYRSACGCGGYYGYRSSIYYGRGLYRRAAVRRFVSFRRGGMRGYGMRRGRR